jgi:hypothetical protein
LAYLTTGKTKEEPMKPWIFALAAAATASTGCTTLSLERQTLAQTGTVVDMRYREDLDNLAMIAKDPMALPSYASIYAGTTQVTDNASLSSTTVWLAKGVMGSLTHGFNSEAANPQVSRAVLMNWSLDPIVVPEKLEAIRCACRWVIYGPEHACDACAELLASPEEAASPGRHFGVADDLAKLPSGWLHLGKLEDVPLNACYKAHSGATWVWVTHEGIKGLADFSLIVQNIARVDSNSPSLFASPPFPSLWKFETADYKPDDCLPYKVTAIVAVDENRHLVPDQPYQRNREDNIGGDPHLRSLINAAGAPH